MRTPIIVSKRGDLSFHASRRKAQTHIEPVDVENHEYKVFDASGVLLDVAVIQEPHTIMWGLIQYSVTKVVIASPDSPSKSPEELRAVLKEFLTRIGHAPETIEPLTIDELIAMAQHTRL